MAVGISTFESTVIYPINRNKVPVFLFFIYDTSETITAMETIPPNTAVVCVPSISVTVDRGSTVVNVLHSNRKVFGLIPDGVIGIFH